MATKMLKPNDSKTKIIGIKTETESRQPIQSSSARNSPREATHFTTTSLELTGETQCTYR